MNTVDKQTAMKNPASHVLVPGVGYVKVGPQPLGSFPGGRCNPPPGVPEDTVHFLLPSYHGGDPVAFHWAKGYWFPNDLKATRLGFTPEYLSSHGWAYVEAAA